MIFPPSPCLQRKKMRSLFLILLAVVFSAAVLFLHAIQQTASKDIEPIIRDLPSVTFDSNGSIFVAWRAYSNRNAMEVVLQKFSSDGIREWSSEKTLIPKTVALADFVHLTSTPNHELLLTWAEKTSAVAPIQYYLQKFNLLGQPITEKHLLFSLAYKKPFIQSSFGEPKLDKDGNISFTWVSPEDNGTSTLRLQTLKKDLSPQWQDGLIIRTINAEEIIFFSDIVIDRENNSRYLTFLSANKETPDVVIYSLIKLHPDGPFFWQRQYRLVATESSVPTIINGPSLNNMGALHFGWATQDASSGLLTQHFLQLSPDGELLLEQSKNTERRYHANIGATSILTLDKDDTIFAISDRTALTLYRYRFSKQNNLSEQAQPVLFEHPMIFPSVFNWSLAKNEHDELALVWSQFNTEKNTFDIYALKFSSVFSPLWVDPQKANSRRVKPAHTKEPSTPISVTLPSLKTDIVSTDSDNDGLNDELETTIFHTDPGNDDSDSDGYLDGEEVEHNYNPLGICRVPRFHDDGTHAYGKGRLIILDDEQCRANYLKNELTKYIGQAPLARLSSQQWQLFINAFIYGDYPILAIVQSIKEGRPTVHPSIPWSLWKEMPDLELRN